MAFQNGIPAPGFKAQEAVMYPLRSTTLGLPRKREGSPLDSDRAKPSKSEHTLHQPGPRPPHEWGQDSAVQAERLAKKAAVDTVKFIRGLPYKGVESVYLLRLLDTLKNIPYESANIRVVALGKTEQGKTSTISSIIGLNVTSTMDGTKSVTAAKIEYCAKYNGQRDPYLVEIYVYEKSYVLRIFEQALREFRSWQQSRQDDPNAEDDWDEEGNETTSTPDRLTSMMTEAFSFRPECSTPMTAKRFLVEESSDTAVLESLEKWLDMVYSAIKGQDHMQSKIEKGFATEDAVKKFIAPFVEKAYLSWGVGTDLECYPYPFVEKTVVANGSKVLGKGEVLVKGTTVVDSPGLGDTNKENVRRARFALKDADRVMIVTNMGRYLSREDVYSDIRFALKSRGPQNILLVITHSAEIKQDTSKDAIRRNFTKVELRAYESVKRQLEEVVKVYTSLIQQENAEDDGTTVTALQELKAHIRRKRKQRIKLANAEHELYVLARNRQTAEEFRNTLLLKTIWRPQYAPLIIVCIDNEEYKKWAPDYLNWAPDGEYIGPRLSLEATGILKLREIIANFPAEGRRETLRHYVHETWPCMINSIEMCGTVPMSERKAQVDDAFARLRQNIVTLVEARYHELVMEHIASVKKGMLDQEKSCAEHGVASHDNFLVTHKIKHPTHKCLMRKHGYTVTLKGEEHDLSMELSKQPRKTILSTLNDLSSTKVPTFYVGMYQDMRNAIEALCTQFRHEPQYDAVGLSAKVQTGIRVRQGKLGKACNDAQKQATKLIREIRDRAEDPYGEDTYCHAAFKAAYEVADKAKKNKFRTLHHARCSAFRKALVAENGPYHQLHTMIFNDLTMQLEKLHQEFIGTVETLFVEIQDEIDMACSVKDDDTKEAKAFKDAVAAYSKKLDEHFKDDIQPLLPKAKTMVRAQQEQEQAGEQSPIAELMARVMEIKEDRM
ncbi:hypothetical protein P171DRAFT_469260 [Karstenula rhodostoma CBS 690.94]|uniref:Dynamin N-terminal domain-containing protein n=1 Tax=Karstenula rhodostoma CBS 690.94 TaxID=1392251 RepID=A0A9P4PRI8_9PLEO|nr:hypothetical protein P171DRAFT_469260 [Karstenula rhodostoma CBS 690.94]